MKGKAVAGLVLGIVAIVLGIGILGGWGCVISLPAAIIGLCLSVSGGKALKAAGQPAGVATAGLVLGIIAVVFTAMSFFSCGLCTICATAALGAAGAL